MLVDGYQMFYTLFWIYFSEIVLFHQYRDTKVKYHYGIHFIDEETDILRMQVVCYSLNSLLGQI